jgi:hypothetical protein
MAVNSSWTEPKSDYKAEYPFNNITQSESGHSIEMDDTPGAERVRIQHRSGTFTEVQADGKRINKVVGDNYEIIYGNGNVLIKGQCNITVEGPCTVNIMGDSYVKIDGDCKQQVNGNLTQSVKGKVDIFSDSDVNLSASGDINLQATAVNVNADLNVRGYVSSTQSVSAAGNVTAGNKCYANISFETMGYISAGAPTALFPIPGYISGLQITDMVRSMQMDRMIYDIHTHPIPHPSPSGPPIQKK